MKNVFLCLLPIVLFFACNKNDVDTQELPCGETSEIQYQDVEVDFYYSHDSIEITETVWATVSEQIRLRPAHKEGAIFEEIEYQVLIKESYLSYEIYDSTIIQLEQNAQLNTTTELICYNFYNESEIVGHNNPAEYMFFIGNDIVTDGTGEAQPAEYMEITREAVVNLAKLNVVENLERSLHRVKFTIPCSMSIEEFLNEQKIQQNVDRCLDENSYIIVE